MIAKQKAKPKTNEILAMIVHVYWALAKCWVPCYMLIKAEFRATHVTAATPAAQIKGPGP